MSWLVALLSLLSSLADWWADRAHRQAGRAEERAERLSVVVDGLREARNARASVSDEPDSVRKDPANRD